MCVSGETKEVWEGKWEVLLSAGQACKLVLKEKRDTATGGKFLNAVLSKLQINFKLNDEKHTSIKITKEFVNLFVS